jgi:hypothetical protein
VPTSLQMARSTRSTSRASTASRSRIREAVGACTTTCSYLADPENLLPAVAQRLGDHLERVSYDSPIHKGAPRLLRLRGHTSVAATVGLQEVPIGLRRLVILYAPRRRVARTASEPAVGVRVL